LIGKLNKFVQGTGSLVIMKVAIKTKPQIKDYSEMFVVYSDYDQGSNISGEPIDIFHKAIFATNYNNYLATYIIIAIIIAVIIAGLYKIKVYIR
jgi:hypothetical protein